MKFFQGLPQNGPVFTKTVITLSFGVRFGPTSTQNACSDRGNPENTPSLRQDARSTLKFSFKQDFLGLKVKEHHSPLFFGQVSEPICTSF
jgi:hypothetical protein